MKNRVHAKPIKEFCENGVNREERPLSTSTHKSDRTRYWKIGQESVKRSRSTKVNREQVEVGQNEIGSLASSVKRILPIKTKYRKEINAVCRQIHKRSLSPSDKTQFAVKRKFPLRNKRRLLSSVKYSVLIRNKRSSPLGNKRCCRLKYTGLEAVYRWPK